MNSPEYEEIKRRYTETWTSPSGFIGWISIVNSRPLGTRYMVTSLLFFSMGIILAVIMRSQLAFPNNDLLGPDAYNSIFTMHGSTMLYLFAVPFIEALGIYFVPLLIGSRDLAYPRMTNLGYWLYLFGGLFMYSSIFFGVVPDAGWTAYPPLSGPKYSGPGLDFWLIGLGMLEIAGITAALEIVVTILKLRAPGMTIKQIPILIWAFLTTGLMILFAFTPLLIGTLLLEMDRTIGTQFFNPEKGGSTLLWQHLFWWFGHPEVYIIFLPATGIVSSIVPVFARRRLVAYPLVVAAIVITGFVSFGLWTHHMFTTGIPELPMHFFTAASYMISLASGVQIFAWIATLWGSRPKYSVQMLFILGFFFIFVNGGLTGVMVATMPFDWQVHETNFVVAHFHHVLIGGGVLPFLAGLYHWFPKVCGRMFNILWAKIGFGIIFTGFNITFIPMYIIGLLGMRRRVYTYPEEMGVGPLNLISTVGAYILAAGFIITLLNLLLHSRYGKLAQNDPWNGDSLEWATLSPPAPYGVVRPPVIRDRYPLWQRPSEIPAESFTQKLEKVSRSLECRPCSWRASLLTDITNAFPQAVQFLPGPTHLPFFIAVVILLASVAILAGNYIVAGTALFFVLVLTGCWIVSDPGIHKEEADLLSERLDIPLEGTGARSLGWWGMVGTLTILFMVQGTLMFSWFYIRLYSDRWPQDGLPLPGLTVPVVVLLLLAVMVVSQIGITQAHHRKNHLFVITTLCSAVLSGTGVIVVQLYDLNITPFSHFINAYASLYFTLNSFSLLMVFIASVFEAALLIRLFHRKEPLDAPRLVLWFQNSALFWYFTIIATALGIAIAYFGPHFL
jgi:cytochrome c oxidase subunit I+III